MFCRATFASDASCLQKRIAVENPFPGMNPYLEASWGDVHHSFITYARDQLRDRLPADLRARVEERVFVECTPAKKKRTIVPDIRVVERPRKKSSSARVRGAMAVAEPFILLVDEPVTEGFIEIREAGTAGRLITVIEVLSPANKTPGEGLDLHRAKQRELRQGNVSQVEIDLLRAGQRPLPLPLDRLSAEQQTPYLIWVRRGWEPLEVEFYRAPLQERLPAIRVPLRLTDKDVVLDLQAVIDQCYRNGDYDADLNYEKDPQPRLSLPDARWLDSLLRKSGRRHASRARNGKD
jgi:hypothetical protein